MKSILKRRDNRSGNNRRRSEVTSQPSTASDPAVVEITAEEVCLSAVPWSAARWPGSSSEAPHDVDAVRRSPASHLRQGATDQLERDIDEDLQSVDERLARMERQLNRQFQRFERRLRSPAVDDPQRRSVCQESGPRYLTFAGNRRWMSLQLDASGFNARDVRVLVDRNQLLVNAVHSETHLAPMTSPRVTSGYNSDVTHRRISRRYLLPGYVRAADLCCYVTSDGNLIIEGEIRETDNDHVTSTGKRGGKSSSRSSKHVKFNLLKKQK